MPARSFDYCALQFLNQWLEKESSICEQLGNSLKAVQLEELANAGKYFRVARNLPTKYDSGDRYGPVLEVLNRIDSVSGEEAVTVVCAAEREISKR